MNRNDPSFQQDLIGFVLGTLGDDERSVFEARLLREAGLKEEVEALRRILQPLDSWQIEEPPVGMVDAIMQRVETTSPLEYVASSASITPEPGSGASRRSRISLRELVALAACIALVVGVFVPGMSRVRARQLQMACGDNMAKVFGGTMQYAAAHNGQMPRVIAPQAWPQTPNRAHFGPAIRLQFVQPFTMICPTSPETAPDAATVYENPGRFLGNVRIRFYSIQNLNGPQAPESARADMPLLADPNPRFEDGQYAPRGNGQLNSRAHGGKGQNTLFFDGSVRFLPKPLIREETDNIWQAETETDSSGTEAPQSATDAFLIP